MNAAIDWFQQSVFATIDVWDWLDIFVLSFVIYRVLILMRGTRALQSLMGLGIVLLLYVVSEILELTTLQWVLDHVFVYVVLALVILFQEDIRRALARAGGQLWTRSNRYRPSDANVTEEVIKALFSLAHRKIGALIVLERSASLDPYCEGSHHLDAAVSTELLQSIFHPSSPLHDGAVILASNRVVAAGAFLPISLSKDIARTWGTRHRAAIGVTEETDGICLVVSEERGTVAIVAGGEIIPVADANDLRQRLAEIFGIVPVAEEDEEEAASEPVAEPESPSPGGASAP